MTHTSLIESIEALFSDQTMGLFFSQYEARPDQKAFAHRVLSTFKKNGISLLEAGTGTGKSLGYLIPAILWAIETGERVIISTHTIPLQEQLIHKEIPLALRLIGKEIGVGIARGMSNYLCEMKLFEVNSQATVHERDSSLFEETHHKKIQTIQKFAQQQKKGSMTRDLLPIAISRDEWKTVAAESDHCIKSQCPFFSSCHFFSARKELNDHKIIVVNHHLLLHDLLQRSEANNWEGSFILPPYSRVILDEGHHLEEVATSIFQIRIDRFDHLHTIRKFQTHIHGSKEHTLSPIFQLLTLIKKEAAHLFESSERAHILHTLEFHLAHAVLELEKNSELFFESLFTFSKTEEKKNNNNLSSREFFDENLLTGQLRITQERSSREEFQHAFLIFCDHKKKYSHFLSVWDELQDKLKKILPLHEKMRVCSHELKIRREKIQKQIEEITLFFSSIDNPEKVCWIEWSTTHFNTLQVSCLVSSFYVGKELKKKLFEPMGSTILVSATLTTRGNFAFIKDRLGISYIQDETNIELIEEVYPSPFFYEQNALLIVSTNFPSSQSSHYMKELQNSIFESAKASNGGVLVLFTSYSVLETVYKAIHTECTKIGLFPIKQGQMARTKLLDNFRESEKGVLFATDSFWEGVDIPGKSLRTVIITKLPFDVPLDPMYQARHEAMEKKGQNSFIHYGLPRAIVKFKQAFGRLIRHKTDFGTVICLDSRLSSKSYGQQFIDSLPACQIWKGVTSQIPSVIVEKMKLHA